MSKIRSIMLRIYKVGILHELVTGNPVNHVVTRSKTNYRAIVITPAQTSAILKALTNALHFALVLTCAATALSSSEILFCAGVTFCGKREESAFQSDG